MVYFIEFSGVDGSAAEDLNEFIEDNPEIQIIDTKYQVVIENRETRSFILVQYEE
ncbi:MAG: hypothetical protein J5934_06370 [Succinivibrio sp.]|nr:hypothetical protein [Succinivibrio sp.]